MGDTTISWTKSPDGTPGKTWNPLRGCTRISEGCRNCYAETIAARFSKPGQAFHGYAKMTKSGPRWTGKISLVESALGKPLSWRKPRFVFVNSTSDLFHEDVPFLDIERIFKIMTNPKVSMHTFQVLTKRARIMETFVYMWVRKHGPLPGNIWLGVSVEDQAAADERIPHLLGTDCPVRFLSVEPLIGPVFLNRLACKGGIHWVIVGGESGTGARPMNPDDAARVRDDCKDLGIPFFFKQAGTVLAIQWKCWDKKGEKMIEWPEEFRIREYPVQEKIDA